MSAPTKKDIQRFMKMMRLQQRFRTMDNRELCWHFIEFTNSLNLDIDSEADQLCETIVERLYPEYDGNDITREDWGWQTPQGRITCATTR